MGSVPILTPSGDNDPQIEPVQTFRHYHYCDACGSFDLESWESVARAPLERSRARLAALALYATPLVLVPAWHATGAVLPLSLVALVLMGIAVQQVLKSLPFEPLRTSGWLRTCWRFALGAGLWFLLLALAEGLSWLLTPGAVALVGGLVVAGALTRRAALAARWRILGVRCRQCAATYAHGAPFFADLDANPRGFAPADIPRPLHRVLYSLGRSVDTPTAEPPGRLPP